MTDATPAVTMPLGPEDWAGPMGARWLAEIDRFESMIAPAGAALMAHAAFEPGERVIDIGCGGGATSLEIARAVGPQGMVLGLDISPDLVATARRRAAAAGLANIRFEVADAAVAAPAGAPFDRLFSRFGCMFFPDPYAAFANLHRMVRPGGRIDLGVWAAARDNVWMVEVGDVIGRHVPLPAPVPRAPGPCALDEPDYVRDLLGKAGFQAITLTAWTGDQLVGGAGATPAEAVEFTLAAPTAGEALAKSAPDVRARGAEDLRMLFERYHGPRGVVMPAKIWMVTASA